MTKLPSRTQMRLLVTFAAAICVGAVPSIEVAASAGLLIFLGTYVGITIKMAREWRQIPRALQMSHIGLAIIVVGTVVRIVEAAIAGGELKLPSYADAIVIPGMLTITVSWFLAARARAAMSQMSDVIDAAATILVPVAVILQIGWPYLTGSTGAAGPERAVNGLVTVVDIVWFALMVLLIYGPGARSAASVWLGIAGTTQLIFDFGIFWGIVTEATWQDQLIRVLPIAMVAYAAGAAHPDFKQFAKQGIREDRFRALPYLASSLLVIPLAVVTQDLILVGAAILLGVLTFARLALGNRTARRLANVAHLQARFAQSLSDADTPEAVIAAAATASSALVGPGTEIAFYVPGSESTQRQTSDWNDVYSTSGRVRIAVSAPIASHVYVALTQIADVLDPAVEAVRERAKRITLEAQAQAEAAWQAISGAADLIGLYIKDEVVYRATTNATLELGFDPVGRPALSIPTLLHSSVGEGTPYPDPGRPGRLVKTNATNQPDGSRIVTILDVTNEQRAAETDHITGLPNLKAFRGQDTIEDAMVVLFHFHGTDRTDPPEPVLRQLANITRRVTRADDTLWKGEGPTLMVTSDIAAGTEWVEQRRRQLANEVEPFLAIHPAVTAGVVVITEARSPDGALHRANLALKHALVHDPNSTTFYTDELEGSLVRTWGIERHLNKALNRADLGEYGFRVVYQPIVNAETHTTEAVEALVRCTHPDPAIGAIFPDEFIPMAERLGLVDRIDRFVLGIAISDLIEFKRFHPNFKIHVNLSPTGLTQSALGSLYEQLRSSDWATSSLVLEITETALGQQDIESLRHACQQLTQLGAEVSIDDFGDGESNFTRIAQLPISEVKLAGHFTDLDDSLMLGNIVRTIHDEGHNIVAENIETHEQAVTMYEAGVDQLQGFYFSRPKPIDELSQWMLRNSPEGRIADLRNKKP